MSEESLATFNILQKQISYIFLPISFHFIVLCFIATLRAPLLETCSTPPTKQNFNTKSSGTPWAVRSKPNIMS